MCETVRVAKNFLDTEFARYKRIEDLPTVLISLLEQKTEKSFNKVKSGVGQTTILKFLGGNWKQHMIQKALDLLREKDEVREAAEVFETQMEADEFRKTVKDLEKNEGIKIPKEKIRPLAEKVVVKQKEKKEKIKQEVKERRRNDDKKVGAVRSSTDSRRDLRTSVIEEAYGISEKEAQLKNIESEIKRFDERVRGAYIVSRDLNLLLKDLEVEKLDGLKSMFVLQDVVDLLEQIKELLIVFGYDYKNLQLEKG